MKRKRLSVVKGAKSVKAKNPEADALRQQVADLEVRLTQMVVKFSQKDQLIASLNGQLGQLREAMALAELRFRQGATESAVFDPATMSFVEPKGK